MAEPLLIVGASGRAAAASALRAGLDPFVFDLFADADTCRLCPVLKCDPTDYPHGFVELANRAPPGPWMYTGGLENHPDVVAAISEKRELRGNGPEVLRRVRDPWFLDSLPKHVAGFAEVAARADDTAPWGWVRKPLAGSGGGGVRRVQHGDRADDAGRLLPRVHCGEPESAMFHINDSPATSLGLTLQLVGTPWLHARRFSTRATCRGCGGRIPSAHGSRDYGDTSRGWADSSASTSSANRCLK